MQLDFGLNAHTQLDRAGFEMPTYSSCDTYSPACQTINNYIQILNTTCAIALLFNHGTHRSAFQIICFAIISTDIWLLVPAEKSNGITEYADTFTILLPVIIVSCLTSKYTVLGGTFITICRRYDTFSRWVRRIIHRSHKNA